MPVILDLRSFGGVQALGAPIRWKFTFTTGGVGTFLHVFQATLHYVRVTLRRSGRLVDARAVFPVHSYLHEAQMTIASMES